MNSLEQLSSQDENIDVPHLGLEVVENLDSYRRHLKCLAENNVNQDFSNPSNKHAAAVFAVFFNSTKQILKIYSGSFSGHISKEAEYVDALEDLLQRGVKVKILLQSHRLKLNPEPHIFNLIRYYSIFDAKQIEIKEHPYQVMQNGHEVHFCIGDGKMYRLEEDIEAFTARGNFNDVKESQKWESEFDKIFNDIVSTTVPLYGKYETT